MLLILILNCILLYLYVPKAPDASSLCFFFLAISLICCCAMPCHQDLGESAPGPRAGLVNAIEIRDTCEAEEETPLLDVSMGIVRGDVGKYYDPTYILLDELGVMTDDVDDTDDVDEWLGINKEVHEVTRVVDECKLLLLYDYTANMNLVFTYP